MAFLDDINRAIVLRVVYAGPPMSGKTATLHALSRHLLGARYSEAVFTPEEASGRTLFFDWLEYSAGLFQGRRIRCQIVSVPGQTALSVRRKTLLESADTVVYVVDAHHGQAEEILRFYREMRRFIAKPEAEPPVGVIVQANKADLPNALSNAQIKKLLDDSPNLGVIATTATVGTGVREAFVQAVGLGLARVREQIDNGQLQPGDPDIASGEDLLQRLRELEDREFGRIEDRIGIDDPIVEVADMNLRQQAVAQFGALIEHDLTFVTRNGQKPVSPPHVDGEDAALRPPPMPDNNVNAGLVWPAIGGRIILHEISRQPVPMLQRRPDSAWTADVPGGWSLVSLPEHRFDSEIRAREEILRLARIHASFGRLLSEHRCVTCSASGNGDWRIWQIVRCESTLSDIVRTSLGLTSAETIATELLRAGRLLWTAVHAFRAAAFPRAAALQTIAISHGSPVYSGFMLDGAASIADTRFDAAETLRVELHDAVTHLSRRTEILPRLLRQLEAGKRNAQPGDNAAGILIAMFLYAAA